MAKKTRPLSGQLQRKYFRDLFRSDPGVGPEAIERLTEICSNELAQIRVRLPLATRRPAVREQKPAASTPAAAAIASPSIEAEPAAAFDPHAFSLIVEFRKGGADGLSSRLRKVGEAERLRAIAAAQHVSIEGAGEAAEELIAAIVAGTERRIAHRRAAAS